MRVWLPGRDLSLIIYDGLPSDSVLSNGVTAVSQPTPGEVGLVLAELMLARLKGAPLETLQRLRMPVLLPGDSDGPLPGGRAGEVPLLQVVPPLQVVAASATSQSFK